MTARAGGRRAIVYGRISAAGSDGASVDSQLADGRRVADREGWDIVAEHRDDGISASRYARGKHRPGWQDVMDGIGATLRRGDVLIVWEISRASRDRAVSAALLAACSQAEVLLCVGGKLHDPNDPDDAFMLDLTGALAVRESGITSKRVRRLSDERAADGRPHGRLAYGYQRLYDPRTGRPAELVPDPDTAPIVREIAERMLAGHSLYAIVADLNARGIPSPYTVTRLRNHYPTVETPWNPQQVRRIATSPTIAGLRLHKGVVLPDVEGQWEALVSRADHARLLEISRDRARHGESANRVRHLLTHIATCGACGVDLVARHNNRVPSYTCPRGHVSRKRSDVDKLVTQAVLTRLLDPGIGDALHAGDAAEREAMAAARAEAADLRAQLDSWYAAAAAGTVTPGGLGEVERRLLERIEAAERRARPRRPPGSSPFVAALLAGDVRALWRAATVVQRREAIRELIETIRLNRADAQLRGDRERLEIVWRA